MKPPGACRQGQEAVPVEEEPPDLSPPPPRGATAPSEPTHQTTPVQLVYDSHGVCLEDNTCMSAESLTKVHIKEEPQKYVKEEALSVEGELQSSSSEAGLHGVSAAAMLAGLYTDHVVKDELLLGPELPHRPTVNPVFYEPPPQTTPVQLVYDSHGVCLGDNACMPAESPTKVHIKEEPQETSFLYGVKYVKEEALSVEGELQSSSSEAGLQGVSAAAMMAGLYADHVVKGEVLLGPELPHRPTVNPVFYEPTHQTTPVQLVYDSHGVCLEDNTCMSAESLTKVHIKEEPQKYVKEEALSVEGELQSSSSEAGLHGVSAAAMLAGLYTDHVVKDELLLGPELPHRPTVNPVFYEPPPQTTPVQLVYDSHGVCLGDNACMPAESPTKVHIKEEPQETSFLYGVKYVKEEALSVEGELQSSSSEAGLQGVSAAAMMAGLYADHVVKGEVLLGPELPHRPTVNPVFYGRAVSSDAGVAEALGRRCSVRLERLLLDAERRACRVGRRTYRLRPESEPRRAAAPAADTYRCHHCDKAFRHKSVLSEHMHIHLSTRPAQSRYSTREDSNLDQNDKLDTSLKGNLQRHENTDTREKPFQCNYCDYKCSRKGNLRTHEMTHTGVKPFHCDYCDYKCSLKGNLRAHEMTHTGVKNFQCDYCDYKCNQKGNLRTHEMTHTPAKPYKCNFCDYKCSRKGYLRTHEMTHTGVKPFQCKYCDYKCSQKRNLRPHEMTHTGVKPFQCDYCDYKCSRKGYLRNHEMTHTAAKPYQCNYCDYKCIQKVHLRMHEKTHTAAKPYQCNYCDYKCIQKVHLRMHEMTHTGVKPFQCVYCDYKCNYKGHLRRHEMTHTGVKPYECNYCDYKCSRKRYLRTHQTTHTGVKPYQCNYCDYKCNQKVNLRRHEMTHTGVKLFQCDYCHYKCSRKGYLRKHEMTHTGVKP